MEIRKEININVKMTVERAVAGNKEFHFFVDELTSDDYMPTYVGDADEKYTFDEMDDEFFRFLDKKRQKDGIYLRLLFANSINSASDEAIFELEYVDNKETFKTKDIDDVLVFEFADFGVKVRKNGVTFGATVEGGCSQTPYFAEFGSSKANREFLSLNNPLNRHIISIIEKMIVLND